MALYNDDMFWLLQSKYIWSVLAYKNHIIGVAIFVFNLWVYGKIFPLWTTMISNLFSISLKTCL